MQLVRMHNTLNYLSVLSRTSRVQKEKQPGSHLNKPPLPHFFPRKNITKSPINDCWQCPFPPPCFCLSLYRGRALQVPQEHNTLRHCPAPATRAVLDAKNGGDDQAATYQIKTFQLFVNTPNSQHHIGSVGRREQDQAALCPRLVFSRIDGTSLAASQSVPSMYNALNPSKGVRSGMDFL